MKTQPYSLTILLLVIGFQLLGQQNVTNAKFIFQDSIYGIKQSIFIDYNTKSESYNRICSFSLDPFEKQSYDNSIKRFQKAGIKMTKTEINGFPKRWITLKIYEGDFYVYHPCDFLYNYKVSLNDTTFIEWTGEGPVVSKIAGFKRIDKLTHELKLLGTYNMSKELIIHLVDCEKGIALFERALDSGNYARYLMIDANKVRTVPIIVNICKAYKQRELNFDEPNYNRLIMRDKTKNTQ